MNRYLLIAYKPDSSDHCRGCKMADYSSDFKSFVLNSKEELIKEWANLASYETLINESGYTFQIYVNGYFIWTDGMEYPERSTLTDEEYEEQELITEPFEKEINDIYQMVQEKVISLEQEKKATKEKAIKEQRIKLEEQKLNSERAEFERLKNKFKQ